MADSNTLFLLVSYTVFVSVLQNILFTEATILILKYVYFCIVFAKDDSRIVKLSNLKEMARTVVYIQEHGYDTVDDLQKHRQQLSGKRASVQETLAQTDARIKAINEQIHFTGQYYAIRQIQKDFLKARFKKKYREEHRAELDQYQEAVSFFREQCGGKVPVMKELKAEKEKLLTLQSEQLKELSGVDQMERELQTAAANVDAILHPDTVPEKRQTRHQPEIK